MASSHSDGIYVFGHFLESLDLGMTNHRQRPSRRFLNTTLGLLLLAIVVLGPSLALLPRPKASCAEAAVVPMVAAGFDFTLGLRADGTVAAAGSSSWGQSNVGSWTDIVQVAAGYEHAVGLKINGRAVATGQRGSEQCDVDSWAFIRQVSAGRHHTVGLETDGTVVAVGDNVWGECDVGSWTSITQVAAGYYHTVGLRSDGTVVAAGENGVGESDVADWTGIQQVTAGSGHTVGLKLDGTVVAVGDNSHGKCDVSSWTGIRQIAAGDSHTVGLRSDGTVVAIGDNHYGQCDVSSWSGIQQVAAGFGHTVGLKSDGTVVAAGWNESGQCNFGSWTGIEQVSAGIRLTVGLRADGTVVAAGYNGDGQCDVDSWRGIRQVAAGGDHAVGLKLDGTVVAIGFNDYSQCGVGSWTGIQQVAAGRNHTVGLRSDGTVVATGFNYFGGCDVGSWAEVVQVSAGYSHTVGLRSDGTVMVAGWSFEGEGNVGSWRDIVQVAAGYSHTVGLKSDGTVVATGNNEHGQCDVGSWTGIRQVAAGYYHTVGLKSDGTVVVVGDVPGDNDYGQGNVGSWAGLQQLAAGDLNTVGLRSDGTVVAVGWNNYGQCNTFDWDLGSAAPHDAVTPAAVEDLGAKDATASSVTLTWTAPGDDGDTGTASSYDIRYSTENITDANWESAVQCIGEPNPRTAGSPETYAVTKLASDTTYFFAIKSADEVSNWSGLSNTASKGTEAGGTTDATPPTTPLVVVDGGEFAGTTQLRAFWESSDPESGIVEYQYAVGTSVGGMEVRGWTSAGTDVEATRSVAGLDVGATYYFSVRAKNGNGLWSEVGTSSGITVTAVTLDYSPDWADRQLVWPEYYRPADAPGAVVLGVYNKRDMWYVLRVFTRQQGEVNWEPYYQTGWYPSYLAPYSKKTFTYTPKPGEEIKIEVWNDPTDTNLAALWGVDFIARALFGICVPPDIVDSVGFEDRLVNFYSTTLDPIREDLVHNRQPRRAMDFIVKKLMKKTAMLELQGLLRYWGIAKTEAQIASAVAGQVAGPVLNAPIWWSLLDNIDKGPVREEIVFVAKARTSLASPNIKVTRSLSLVETSPYWSGETVTALFTVTNRGTEPAMLNLLTAGGRGPGGDSDVRDFSFDTAVLLAPGEPYEYEGTLSLSEIGTHHFFVAYQTSDGQWYTSVPTEGSAANTLDIEVGPVPDGITSYVCSPVELRVYDSEGRVTGLVDGEVTCEIPLSTCCRDMVFIAHPDGPYVYEVVGTSDGAYGFAIVGVAGAEVDGLSAVDIPTTAGAVHQWTVDWEALAQGGAGATVCIDADGDGEFERTVTSDGELTADEFDAAGSRVHLWVYPVAAVGGLVGLGMLASLGMWLKRRFAK